MPAVPTAFAPTDQDFKDLTRYVRSLSGLVEADEAAQAKAAVFAGYCASCHGADGAGNPMLGAPNLIDDVWLYGSSEDAVYTSLVKGRSGLMPSHGNLLGEDRTKILSAYVYSLSQ
jgi:cytochrome c oxidase cbb3-type subunit 3